MGGIRARQEQDLVMFYFSGEGIITDGEAGINVWAAKGQQNHISDQDLLDAIGECTAGRKICILDTYFADSTLSPETKAAIRTSRGSNSSSVSFLSNSLFSKTPELLQSIRPIRDLSWFSGFLLSGLRRAADTKRSGVVDMGELYDYLAKALEMETEGKVVPQLSEGSDRTCLIVPTD